MNTATESKIKWTSADLELLPDSSNRYEIIDGELEVTRAPHWKHQKTLLAMGMALQSWSLKTGLGDTIINPGLIFSAGDNVIPDLVWISKEKLAISVDKSGHLTSAPELIVEVLSDNTNDIRRDKETKLKLYSLRGVQEYWIADWRLQTVEIYKRNKEKLILEETLLFPDEIKTTLLPEFSCRISQIFN